MMGVMNVKREELPTEKYLITFENEEEKKVLKIVGGRLEANIAIVFSKFFPISVMIEQMEKRNHLHRRNCPLT